MTNTTLREIHNGLSDNKKINQSSEKLIHRELKRFLKTFVCEIALIQFYNRKKCANDYFTVLQNQLEHEDENCKRLLRQKNVG